MHHLQQRQYFLAQVVVEVGVLGITHVVDEHQSRALGVDALQCDIQLINDTLPEEERNVDCHVLQSAVIKGSPLAPCNKKHKHYCRPPMGPSV